MRGEGAEELSWGLKNVSPCLRAPTPMNTKPQVQWFLKKSWWRGLWVLNLNYLNAFLIKGPGLVTIHRCMFCTNSWPARNEKLSVRYEFSRNLLQIIFNFLFDGFMILEDRCLDGGMGGGILHREGRETWGWESSLFPECRAWG